MNNAPIIGQEAVAVTATAPLELDLDLEAAKARRESLRHACARVRRLLPGDPAGGAAALLAAVTDLDRTWRTHTAETESPDGMLAQVLHDCPRLAPSVRRLRREHEVVAA